MGDVSSKSVTGLLLKWRAGDQEALKTLIPIVYRELRSMARRHLRRERPDHTLESAALVHEAYLRLAQQDASYLQNRTHFFAVASELMRHILVSHARARRALKREAGGCKLALDEAVASSRARDVDLVALDDALNSLAELDARQSRIVELRFFGGLSIEDTSEVLGVSPVTIKREWSTAKAWLYRAMSKDPA
jgi:RNA polymerase sigma factor (TIGR02999 family)